MRIYRSRRYRRSQPNPLKRLAAYAVLATVIVFIMGIWGVTLLANLSNFWESVRGNNAPLSSQDKAPPSPPRLDQLPTFTNKSKVSITGTAESGSTVSLFIDGEKKDEQIVGNDGQFGFRDLILGGGPTSFYAIAKDGTGNESPASNTVSVTYDKTPPKISSLQPADGTTSSSQYVTISGKTEAKTTVTIDGQQLIVQSDGSFSGTATLTQTGANTVTITVTDQAGNQTKATLTINYAP